MELTFPTAAKKWMAGSVLVLAAAGYTALAGTRFLAAVCSQSPHLASLRLAVRFDPGSAAYRNAIGVYQLLRQSPRDALPWLQSATKLDPSAAKYWMDLAVAQQLAGNLDAERSAIDQALAMDPRTPDIAWQAANLLLAQGATGAALQQFHTVLQNDSQLVAPAIATTWKIRPDADFLLGNVVPQNANPAFLDFLLSQRETDAAAKVWQSMFAAQESVDRRYLLEYMRYLLANHQVSQALLVWQQGAKLSGLAAYQASAENLLVNGDFSLDILNGGFDWVHQPVEGVALALDPAESRSSSRSLRITLDGSGISDAGIAQRVPVEPNHSYEFSAFYKAKDMDGAGSLQFSIQDAYAGTTLFTSDDLRNADFWKKVGGTFVTPSNTNLILLHVLRTPPGSPIRGRLWLDGLQLIDRGKDAQ